MTDSIFRRLLFLAGFAALPVWSQPVELVPGEPAVIDYPAIEETTLFNGDSSLVIVVPPDTARLVIDLAASPPETELDLFARFDEDVEINPEGFVFTDHSSTGAGGTEQIVIDDSSVPPLEEGTYFIATLGLDGNQAATGTIVATLVSNDDIAGLATLARSDFESGIDGWTINYPAPEPEIRLRTVGDPDSVLSVTPPNRDESRALVLEGRGVDAFVTPSRYLGNSGLYGCFSKPQDVG